MAKREMTMMELQDILGKRMRVTLDNGLTPEERENENEQTKVVLEIGKQMINNADISMRYEVLQAKCKGLTTTRMTDLIGE